MFLKKRGGGDIAVSERPCTYLGLMVTVLKGAQESRAVFIFADRSNASSFRFFPAVLSPLCYGILDKVLIQSSVLKFFIHLFVILFVPSVECLFLSILIFTKMGTWSVLLSSSLKA